MDVIFLPAFQQSLLFLPLCFGIYLSYRIMQVTDLTVEATFVTGAGLYAHLLFLHVPFFAALCLAIMAGAGVGALVALMQKVTCLDPLIVSVLAIFMMYSVNLLVMGRPNISLLSSTNSLQYLSLSHPFLFWMLLTIISVILLLAMMIMLKSRFGLLLRTLGDNRGLLKSLGLNDLLIYSFGLMLSNGLSALTGVLTAQVNGYADINMSPGVALTAIGTVIIGLNLSEKLYPRQSFSVGAELLGCLLGVMIYFLLLNILLTAGVDPLYMKCVLGLLLLFFLSLKQRSIHEVNV